MKRYRALILYGGAALWGIIVMAIVILLFFPYQRALRIALQNVLGGSRMIVSVQGVHPGLTSLEATKVVVDHASLEAGTLAELSKARVVWYPLSLFMGKLVLFSQAQAYGGVLQCTIDGIPVLGGASPDLFIQLKNLNLGMYPEGRLPWFKGISGTMNGWIRQRVALSKTDKEKGSFSIRLTDGEIREPVMKDLQRLILPYKEILAEGTVSGGRIDINKIAVTGDGIVLRGSGTIEPGEPQRRLNITLQYEGAAAGGPLTGKGALTISGNQWSPQVAITPARPEDAKKQAPDAG